MFTNTAFIDTRSGRTRCKNREYHHLFMIFISLVLKALSGSSVLEPLQKLAGLECGKVDANPLDIQSKRSESRPSPCYYRSTFRCDRSGKVHVEFDLHEPGSTKVLQCQWRCRCHYSTYQRNNNDEAKRWHSLLRYANAFSSHRFKSWY